MICPKSQHKFLAQVGSARGPHTWQPPPEPREQQCLVREGRPLQGCMGHIVRGWVDPRALDVERGPTKGLGLPRSFLLLPFGTGRRPQPAPGIEPKKIVAAASRLLGSRFQDGQLRTWWGLRLHSSQSYGGGQQKGGWPGGWPGGGTWREEREGEPSSCSVQHQQPGPLQGPQGLVHSSHRDQQTWICTHTRARTATTHTHTYTPPHIQT